jgi:hypothetical protein
MELSNSAAPSINDQATQAYMANLQRSQKFIEMAHTEGFDHGARTALMMVAERFKKDAASTPDPSAHQILSYVASFILAIAQGGNVNAITTSPPWPRHQSTDTGPGADTPAKNPTEIKKKTAQKGNA